MLAAAGLDFKHVVRVTSYLGRQDDLAEYNRIYREYFQRAISREKHAHGLFGHVVEVRGGCSGVSGVGLAQSPRRLRVRLGSLAYRTLITRVASAMSQEMAAMQKPMLEITNTSDHCRSLGQ